MGASDDAGGLTAWGGAGKLRRSVVCRPSPLQWNLSLSFLPRPSPLLSLSPSPHSVLSCPVPHVATSPSVRWNRRIDAASGPCTF